MTIAAGFVYDEGLILCADTKITTAIKTHESKLVECIYRDRKCYTAFAVAANDLKFAKSAIDSCEEAVAKVNFADASVNIETIRKTIQSALTKFYKDHVFPNPDQSQDGIVYFDLLIGIWLKGQTRMFVSRQTVLYPVDEYECLGTGGYLAKYLIGQYLKANPGKMNLADAALIATASTQAVTGYDEACDGEPEILIMRNSGECGNAYDSAGYPDPTLIEKLNAETWKMLRFLANSRGDLASESGKILEEHFERVREINNSYKWYFDRNNRG
jgi:20S proteasome alpha/beta subunit